MAKRRVFDAVVVGSGATGGWVARELTAQGLEVALVEAGSLVGPERPSRPARTWDAITRRDQAIQRRCASFGPTNRHLFVSDRDQPYSMPAEKPFHWIRSRVLAGRMTLWGGVCVRMSDFEFQAGRDDGLGGTWPITHAELAPFYAEVERFMVVRGDADRLPQLPDGEFISPPPTSPAHWKLKEAVQRRWPERSLIQARVASQHYRATLAEAALSGKLTVVSQTVARKIRIDPRTGRAKGVQLVHARTGDESELHGRVVFLCASTLESTRLMLNSSTRQHPRGLGNSSGALGHYLMDHTSGIQVVGVLPRGKRWKEPVPDPCYPHRSYLPRFRNLETKSERFRRGYGVMCFLNGFIPSGLPPEAAARVAEACAGEKAVPVVFTAFGEMLPRAKNRVYLDPQLRDRHGIRSLRIECSYGENEFEMAKDQAAVLGEVARIAGVEVVHHSNQLSPPGEAIHEMGTARMGRSAQTSVLNRFNQSWDVANLFVVDGACFPSGGYQNPTLTMMALALRSARFVVEQLKRRNL